MVNDMNDTLNTVERAPTGPPSPPLPGGALTVDRKKGIAPTGNEADDSNPVIIDV
jgi:hypothetical protein